MNDVPWKSLHPASVLVNLIPRGWAVVRQAWPLLLVWVAGGRAQHQQMADLTILLGFLFLTVWSSVVHWWTLRYRFVGDRLEIRSGLIATQTRVIAPKKVQNVEIRRNVFQRLAGLAEVRIETASDAGAEGLLSALSMTEADAIVATLASARGRPQGEAQEDAPPLVGLSAADLLLYSATSLREGIAALMLAVFVELTQGVDPQRQLRFGMQAGWTGLAALIAILVAAGWAFGAGRAMLQHAGFKLERVGDALVATEGLLTRRRVELPLRKVQRLAIHAPWLRRRLGFSSVHVESAVVRRGEGGTERALAVVPVARPDDVHAVAVAVLGASGQLVDRPLTPPPPAALRRALVQGTLRALIPAVAVAVWRWPWGAIALLAVPLSAAVAWLDVRAQGWLVTARHVVVRTGYLDRVTTIVARDRLQAVDLRQGPLLARYGLGQIHLSVAGSVVEMPLMAMDDAYALTSRLSAEACPTRPKAPDGAALRMATE